VRLRWRDFDFDRRVVSIWQGKGRVDRQVMLPASFEPLLRQMSKTFQPSDFVFPGQRHGRHLSPRSAMLRWPRTGWAVAKAPPKRHQDLLQPPDAGIEWRYGRRVA